MTPLRVCSSAQHHSEPCRSRAKHGKSCVCIPAGQNQKPFQSGRLQGMSTAKDLSISAAQPSKTCSLWE